MQLIRILLLAMLVGAPACAVLRESSPLTAQPLRGVGDHPALWKVPAGAPRNFHGSR